MKETDANLVEDHVQLIAGPDRLLKDLLERFQGSGLVADLALVLGAGEESLANLGLSRVGFRVLKLFRKLFQLLSVG